MAELPSERVRRLRHAAVAALCDLAYGDPAAYDPTLVLEHGSVPILYRHALSGCDPDSFEPEHVDELRALAAGEISAILDALELDAIPTLPDTGSASDLLAALDTMELT